MYQLMSKERNCVRAEFTNQRAILLTYNGNTPTHMLAHIICIHMCMLPLFFPPYPPSCAVMLAGSCAAFRKVDGGQVRASRVKVEYSPTGGPPMTHCDRDWPGGTANACPVWAKKCVGFTPNKQWGHCVYVTTIPPALC